MDVELSKVAATDVFAGRKPIRSTPVRKAFGGQVIGSTRAMDAYGTGQAARLRLLQWARTAHYTFFARHKSVQGG
jgi:hypothetical protein